jgi:peptide chain release factor 1
MDLAPLVEKRRARLAELEDRMADPALFDNQQAAGEITREHRRISELLATADRLKAVRRQAGEAREMARGADELAALAADELPALEHEEERLDRELRYHLLPRDLAEERDALVEIRAGTGGDEASLFAADLLRMYQRYAESRGWKSELLEASPSEVGGFREVVVRVAGQEVFRWLKYESGVHRVQRVPATEAQGRIHTSTATVAVLPEAEEVDVELRPDELRIEVCRSGGAGGQHVNRTESAVQVFHLPSGLMVRCEDGRSQTKNKEKALLLLRSKLLERERGRQAEQYSESRRRLIGSGGREEKIRTYNFPQNRVTDHRIGLTLYNLDAVIDGDLNPLAEALQASEMAERLAELQ